MAKTKKANKSKKLMEFTCFKKFAPELRNMVWKFALPEANIVKIRARGEDKLVDGVWQGILSAVASYRIPVLLQISRESREVGLKLYTKIFPTQFKDKPVFFNLAVDILSIQEDVILRHLCSLGGFRLKYKPDDPTPAFRSPIMHGLRRLQFGEDIPFPLSDHIKMILIAFGKPELVVLHKPGSRRRFFPDTFSTLQRDVKHGVGKWTVGEEEDCERYVPELQILTEFQLKRLIKKIDRPPTRPKKVNAPKVPILPIRRSDRVTERPLDYYEDGPEIEEENTEDGSEENGGAENEDEENDIDIEFSDGEED